MAVGPPGGYGYGSEVIVLVGVAVLVGGVPVMVRVVVKAGICEAVGVSEEVAVGGANAPFNFRRAMVV